MLLFQTFLWAGDDAVRSHVLSSVSGEVSGPQLEVSSLQGGAVWGTPSKTAVEVTGVVFM